MSTGHSSRPVVLCSIYFFQIGDSGPIKIGRTGVPVEKRFSGIQFAMPFLMRILATIPAVPPEREGEIHEQFRHLRVRGEWFQPGPDLLDFIASAAEPWLQSAYCNASWKRDIKRVDHVGFPLRESPPGPVELMGPASMAGLKDEHRAILIFAEKGWSGSRIAAVLGISDRTVKRVKAAIREQVTTS